MPYMTPYLPNRGADANLRSRFNDSAITDALSLDYSTAPDDHPISNVDIAFTSNHRRLANYRAAPDGHTPVLGFDLRKGM